MNKTMRWKQRFQNLTKAYLFLEKAVKQKKYDELQAVGLIKSFEFTFELSWKTLKDYLESMGDSAFSPREVLKKAFATQLIDDGHLWIEMLDKRNELTHTYNEAMSKRAVQLINERYFLAVQQVYEKLKTLDAACSD